jgi:hypothetical protein
MARCSPVLVKMPSRAPSRTSTEFERCACIVVATSTMSVRPLETWAGRRNALVHSRHRERLQLALAVALRECAELVRQIREQQRTECRVAEISERMTALLTSYATTSSAATKRLLARPANSERPSKQSSGP